MLLFIIISVSILLFLRLTTKGLQFGKKYLDASIERDKALINILETQQKLLNNSVFPPTSSILLKNTWNCPICGSLNPSTFLICHKCKTGKKIVETKDINEIFCKHCKKDSKIENLFFKKKKLYAVLECKHSVEIF